MRRVPIHRSLSKPILIMGCDRVLLILTVTLLLCLTLMGGLFRGNWFAMGLGLVLQPVAFGALSHMGKVDAQLREVWVRACSYPPAMRATGRWDAPSRRHPSWI